tara:strand:+ start:2469 stop:2792 length:324 start_codon:yes stop_codon:yes gene_type:complete
MTKLLPANVSAASNSSELAMKFVLAATLADSIARRSFPVGAARLTTRRPRRWLDDDDDDDEDLVLCDRFFPNFGTDENFVLSDDDDVVIVVIIARDTEEVIILLSGG